MVICEEIVTTHTNGHQVVESIFVPKTEIMDVVNLKVISAAIFFAHDASPFINGDAFRPLASPLF